MPAERLRQFRLGTILPPPTGEHGGDPPTAAEARSTRARTVFSRPVEEDIGVNRPRENLVELGRPGRD